MICPQGWSLPATDSSAKERGSWKREVLRAACVPLIQQMQRYIHESWKKMVYFYVLIKTDTDVLMDGPGSGQNWSWH